MDYSIMFKFMFIEHYLSILVGFYKKVGRLWSCVWLWRISGGYSREMMEGGFSGLFLPLPNHHAGKHSKDSTSYDCL